MLAFHWTRIFFGHRLWKKRGRDLNLEPRRWMRWVDLIPMPRQKVLSEGCGLSDQGVGLCLNDPSSNPRWANYWEILQTLNLLPFRAGFEPGPRFENPSLRTNSAEVAPCLETFYESWTQPHFYDSFHFWNPLSWNIRWLFEGCWLVRLSV